MQHYSKTSTLQILPNMFGGTSSYITHLPLSKDNCEKHAFPASMFLYKLKAKCSILSQTMHAQVCDHSKRNHRSTEKQKWKGFYRIMNQSQRCMRDNTCSSFSSWAIMNSSNLCCSTFRPGLLWWYSVSHSVMQVYSQEPK